jgi:hypothetical protein
MKEVAMIRALLFISLSVFSSVSFSAGLVCNYGDLEVAAKPRRTALKNGGDLLVIQGNFLKEIVRTSPEMAAFIDFDGRIHVPVVSLNSNLIIAESHTSFGYRVIYTIFSSSQPYLQISKEDQRRGSIVLYGSPLRTCSLL